MIVMGTVFVLALYFNIGEPPTHNTEGVAQATEVAEPTNPANELTDIQIKDGGLVFTWVNEGGSEVGWGIRLDDLVIEQVVVGDAYGGKLLAAVSPSGLVAKVDHAIKVARYEVTITSRDFSDDLEWSIHFISVSGDYREPVEGYIVREKTTEAA